MADMDGSMVLSKGELKSGLAEFGIEINLRELDDVFANLDGVSVAVGSPLRTVRARVLPTLVQGEGDMVSLAPILLAHG